MPATEPNRQQKRAALQWMMSAASRPEFRSEDGQSIRPLSLAAACANALGLAAELGDGEHWLWKMADWFVVVESRLADSAAELRNRLDGLVGDGMEFKVVAIVKPAVNLKPPPQKKPDGVVCSCGAEAHKFGTTTAMFPCGQRYNALSRTFDGKCSRG